jgi:hypothetical protein
MDDLFGSKQKTKSKFENETNTDATSSSTSNANTNAFNTQTSNPWEAVMPLLMGNEDVRGLLPAIGDQFTNSNIPQQAQQGLDFFNNAMIRQASSPMFDQVMDGGADALRGKFDTQLQSVGPVGAQSVDLTNARASQGVLDPTRSLKSLLSGNVNNPFLQQQSQAMINDLTRNLQTNVLPSIRSEAMNSGQFGGSRQGIAEGLAMSRMNQDLAPAITNLFGGAFENAQQRMMGTANMLNDQAVGNATNNVNRDLQAQMFNADLAMRGNEQNMQNNQLNLGNRMQGQNMLGQGMGLQNQLFGNFMNTQFMPQQLAMDNLNNFAGLLFPAAGLGGTQTGNATQTANENTSQTASQTSKSRGTGTNTQTATPGIVPAILGTISGITGISRQMSGSSGLLGGGAK